MYESELQDQADGLWDFYRSCFRKKYGIDPVKGLDRADITFCRDLIRQVGSERSRKIIEGFLRSEHSWFKQKSHSLVALKGNIDVVNTELAKKERPSEPRSQIQIMPRLDVAIWYFKESSITRASFKCRKEGEGRDAKFFDAENRELDEGDIARLVGARVC